MKHANSGNAGFRVEHGKFPRRVAVGTLFDSVIASGASTVVLTILVGWLGFGGTACQVRDGQTIGLLLIAHACVLFWPLETARRAWRKTGDLFDPIFVSSATFAIFHVMLNPVILSSPGEMKMFGLERLSEPELTRAVVLAYAVTAVAWIGLWLGLKWTLGRRNLPARGSPPLSGSRSLIFSLGLFYVGVGIIGNLGAIGGWDAYWLKMTQFFARWETYEENMLGSGTMKWDIAMRFLPMGLLLLAYAHAFGRSMFHRRLAQDLVVVSLLNVFLNCATGQRSYTLMVAIYSIVIVNHEIQRFRLQILMAVAGVLITTSIVLGTLRDAFYFGDTDVKTIASEYILNGARHFAAMYLTNFAGTLALVSEVVESGTVSGATAFSGVTGLLGGPTPLNTQTEMSYRVTGQYMTGSPRYGPPGEFFFNFGWSGVIIGMVLVGCCVGVLARLYRARSRFPTVSAGLLAVYCVLTAEGIVIANLNYIPPYFTYYSVPFILVFALEYFVVPRIKLSHFGRRFPKNVNENDKRIDP